MHCVVSAPHQLATSIQVHIRSFQGKHIPWMHFAVANKCLSTELSIQRIARIHIARAGNSLGVARSSVSLCDLSIILHVRAGVLHLFVVPAVKEITSKVRRTVLIYIYIRLHKRVYSGMNVHVYRNVHITIYMWVDYNQMSRSIESIFRY